MIENAIWQIEFFVFRQSKICFVSAKYFFYNFINFPKIDRFRKIASTKRNQIDTVLCMFPGGRVGSGRVGSFIDFLQLIVSTLRVQKFEFA